MDLVVTVLVLSTGRCWGESHFSSIRHWCQWGALPWGALDINRGYRRGGGNRRVPRISWETSCTWTLDLEASLERVSSAQARLPLPTICRGRTCVHGSLPPVGSGQRLPSLPSAAASLPGTASCRTRSANLEGLPCLLLGSVREPRPALHPGQLFPGLCLRL